MYSFTDTTAATTSVGNSLLPAEALKINGAYIENQISGYRTLNVSGREALSPELETYEVGSRDGSGVKHKRYPARIITVTFQLIADSDANFRTAFNNLAKILDVENAQLIFADETDKFYTGTPSSISEVDPGRNSVIGEFELYCADPFKYSVAEYTVTPNNGQNNVTFNYNGTYKAFPKLETFFHNESESGGSLTGYGDCGFVSFYDANKNIIQLGDPEEVDADYSGEESQTLMYQIFDSANSTTTHWTANNGKIMPADASQMGTIAMKSIGNTAYYLGPTSYGTLSGKWHGPSLTRNIPADSANITGAESFLISYKHKMCIDTSADALNEYGLFQVQVTDADNNIIAGVMVGKWSQGKTGVIQFYVNGSMVKSIGNIDLSHWNPLTGRNEAEIPTCWIRKTGSEIVFNLIGNRFVTNCAALENTKARKVTFMFGQHSDKPVMPHNGIFWFKFVKQNCSTYRDVPNKFSSNDKLIVDCRTAEISLNGVSAPELGALGNDWEKFCLTPGTNSIGFSHSSWVRAGYEPTFRIKYREVFL